MSLEDDGLPWPTSALVAGAIGQAMLFGGAGLVLVAALAAVGPAGLLLGGTAGTLGLLVLAASYVIASSAPAESEAGRVERRPADEAPDPSRSSPPGPGSEVGPPGEPSSSHVGRLARLRDRGPGGGRGA
jgi:hypothetical protein